MKSQYVDQANRICRTEWTISALGHNLVMLVLQKYKEQGFDLSQSKENWVEIPIKDLFRGVENRDGGNQYKAAMDTIKTLHTTYVVMARVTEEDGEVAYGFNIFAGQSQYKKNSQTVICSLNPALYRYWHDLTGDYTKLRIDKVLQLPLNTTAHLLYQFLASYKYQGQFMVDIDILKKEIGCEKMDMRDFTRRILVKYQKEFTERDILRWDYELVRGRYKKIIKIKVVFPEKSKPQQTDTDKKKTVKSVVDWGWIPLEVVERAEKLVKTEVWREALRNLAGVRDSVPPEERRPDHPELLRFIRQMEYAEQNTIKGY